MRPLVVHSRAGLPPRGVQDLNGGDGASLDQAALVTVGQALTWQSTFSSGPVMAVPLTGASALVLADRPRAGAEQWHDRFARGLAHRMAGELTIASVTAGLLGAAAADTGDAGEDEELLGSAIDGLMRLLGDLERAEATADLGQIVADAARTHLVLLGRVTDQQISCREHEDFALHTVRSVSGELQGDDLERVRGRIGLPWPARTETGLGPDLGLARWRATVEAHGHQMWCRVEDGRTLVTELWLRNPPRDRRAVPRARDSRSRSG
ncbi:hypothetical protein ACRYCC_13170 [Actinomadura scrupuli]|uniref:hypothetical protein n=1 Tax=Actinomadura scrupuli TaxID=559629 RepID=UPI003D9989BA